MAARPGLYVDDNSGNGVTDPQSARLALASLLSGPGIISGTQGNVTGSSSGPNMKYVIPAESFATQRGTLAADGLYLWPNDAPVTVDSGSPAPSSGKRYDVIWAAHNNAYTSDGFADADSLPHLGVTIGTASSTPAVPAAPAGALVLAQSLVGTSIANAAAATITQVAAITTLGPGVAGYVISDANLATAPGNYNVNATNVPGGSGWWFVAVEARGTVVLQTAMASTATTASFATWQRSYDGSSWTAWTLVGGAHAARRRGVGAAFNLAGGPNVVNPVTGWGTDQTNKGDIAYAGGIFTAGSPGTYRWDATLQWPGGSGYRIFQYVLINGALDGGGQQTRTVDPSASTLSGGMSVELAAGDTVQIAVQATTGGVAGVIPVAFSLVRVA